MKAAITAHAYGRDPQSGAGNCWCGRWKEHPLHSWRAFWRARLRGDKPVRLVS